MNKLKYDYPLKFIWGVKSHDDLTLSEANLYTMNDIDIIYNMKTKKYSLGVETIYSFPSLKAQLQYFEDLLDKFTAYAVRIGIDTNKDANGNFTNTVVNCEFDGDSIEEVYYHYKNYVLNLKRKLSFQEK